MGMALARMRQCHFLPVMLATSTWSGPRVSLRGTGRGWVGGPPSKMTQSSYQSQSISCLWDPSKKGSATKTTGSAAGSAIFF